MLETLRIKNLAIIEELEIDFSSGLNIITGETGAGKSIVLKAIELLTGVRGQPEIVRKDAESCEVEGIFSLTEGDKHLLAKLGEETEELLADDELLVRRTVTANGRSKVYINNRLSTLALVKALVSQLVDITSQHEQRLLVDTTQHRELLDRFGVSRELIGKVREAYQDYYAKKRAYDSYLEEKEAYAERFEKLRYELDELEQAELQEGELDELDAELRRLSSVEELGMLSSEMLALLDEGDESLAAKLGKFRTALDEAAKTDNSFQAISDFISTAVLNLDEAKFWLADYQAGLEANPERLREVESRMAELTALERKYSRPFAALLSYKAEITQELSLFDAGAFDEKTLRENLEKSEANLAPLEDALSEERTEQAVKLAAAVEKELHKVNMKKAKFKVSIEQGLRSAHGKDVIEFLIASNPGQPFQALSKTASGGELSRVLLVLKAILNQQLGASVQIFDEIDTGIGGNVAHVVGEKLQRISRFSQVVLVTHAPQIAAMADNHYLISKLTKDQHTTVKVSTLNTDGRVLEVARMLAGKKITKKFEESAKELLSTCVRSRRAA